MSCESSNNVEFYNPDVPEPECTASPAIYDIKFVTTWTESCQSDYVVNSQWASFIATAHNTELLNGLFSGSTVDIVRDPPITEGNGTSSNVIVVDRFHQWVSAFSRQGPSPDYIVGVADLRLCDGDEWKENVKVCFELFSTAAASERVVPEMMRNSIQGNNCSYMATSNSIS